MLCAALAVAGSLAGSMLLFFLARRGGEAYLKRHTMSARGARFQRWFQHYGLITVFIPAILVLSGPGRTRAGRVDQEDTGDDSPIRSSASCR